VAWRPILEGELAERARAVIAAISDDVPRHPLRDPYSLPNGAAGVALYYAYAGDEDRATEYLERAVDALAQSRALPWLHGGFTGVAWTLGHLVPDGENDPTAETDAALLDLVRQSPWRRPYDLISGLAGYAVHAIEQRRRGLPSGEVLLDEIVQRLEEITEPAGDALTILSNPAGESDEMRQGFPDGIYNVGLAHGLPAVIGVLGSVAGPRARRLRDGYAAWLGAKLVAGDDGSLLPHLIDKRHPDRRGPSRAAWCYGDPGVAIALLRGARAAGDPALEDLALTLGRAAAARTIAGSGVVDAGLCHGAAGLLHIFNRFYQATGDEHFRTAALTWAEETLRYQGDRGVAGYLCYRPERDGGAYSDASFLLGAAGIGLALIAATSDVEPRWDATLLCDAA
jgi:lantibiotic biosynthesis protein